MKTCSCLFEPDICLFENQKNCCVEYISNFNLC